MRGQAQGKAAPDLRSARLSRRAACDCKIPIVEVPERPTGDSRAQSRDFFHPGKREGGKEWRGE